LALVPQVGEEAMNQLSISPSKEIVPVLVAAADDRAGVRFLELVAAQIRNPHTLRAYAYRSRIEGF